MKTSIASVAISGDLKKKLTVIAGAGFDGIELCQQDLIAYNGSPGDLGEVVRDHGLRIDLLQSERDFGGLPEPLRAKAFDRLERKFDLMAALGTELLLVSSASHEKSLGGIDQVAEDFRELGERAANRGLKVGYEPMSWSMHISDYRDAWEVVRRADHASVGLILDSIHILGKKTRLENIRSIPGNRIFHVQLADAPMIEMNLEYWSRYFRTMPGEGDLALADFMRAVVATGYDGPISLEILNDQFRNGLPRTIAEDGYRSVLHLMDQVRRSEAAAKIETPAMPPKSPVYGIEFIEFAADGEDAQILERILKTMGFTAVAQHIHKQVVLWRQGNINILINTEQKSFAHSAYTVHGTSVCDMALLVEDAQAAGERAQALGANPFSQRNANDELEIPAIRGVGGSILRFLDRKSELSAIWENDFQALADIDTEANAVGLAGIDHVAQTMSSEEMLTWTLFYTSIFEMTKTPMVDSVDPGGMVYSRAIQSGDGCVRFILNGAETQRTFAGRFIADSSGPSVQHLAFASEDIFATAIALSTRGFESLPIPDDYYLDLAARLNIDPALQAKMKSANILYDEDAKGSFFQLYSRPYGAGFFLEIVERRHGYNGYGAPNAPYRLAALKRLSRSHTKPRY